MFVRIQTAASWIPRPDIQITRPDLLQAGQLCLQYLAGQRRAACHSAWPHPVIC